tara:strand:+ start:541 stop:738 length:198 start_codon:yes stop_codon:yes gene_type:complete
MKYPNTPANFTIPYTATILWVVKIDVLESKKKKFDFGNDTDYRTFLDGLISNGIDFSSEYVGPQR